MKLIDNNPWVRSAVREGFKTSLTHNNFRQQRSQPRQKRKQSTGHSPCPS